MLLSKVTYSNSYIHGGGCHARCRAAHQGKFGGSVSFLRTLRQADQGNRTSYLLIRRCWLYPWATAACSRQRWVILTTMFCLHLTKYFSSLNTNKRWGYDGGPLQLLQLQSDNHVDLRVPGHRPVQTFNTNDQHSILHGASNFSHCSLVTFCLHNWASQPSIEALHRSLLCLSDHKTVHFLGFGAACASLDCSAAVSSAKCTRVCDAVTVFWKQTEMKAWQQLPSARWCL